MGGGDETAPAVQQEGVIVATDPLPTTTAAPEETTSDASAVDAAPTSDGTSCDFDGASYKLGEEFHDGCRQFCQCTETGVSCAAIECPHHFGLKLINPDCMQWSQPDDFTPTPPECCPEVTCVDDGSCTFEGEKFRNGHPLPEKLTGCEQRCYCEFGNVTCQSACDPVPATPPRTLPCPPDRVTLGPGSNGCCKLWQCSDGVTSRPSVPPNIHAEGLGIGNEISDLDVRDVDAESVKFSFSIPPALVGLPGKTEVLYTDSPGLNDEASSWDRRVFQTPSGLLDRTDLSWVLGDLRPATPYVMQVKVLFDQSSTILQSNVVEFQTRDAPEAAPTLPPKVEVDAELQASDVDTTSALIQWRRLTEEELRYIDGIQLRYRDVDVDAQVWTMTPFIHRELTTYKLTELKPDTTYEVDIVLMPFQTQRTEMVSSHPLRISTLPVFDRYDFNITLGKVEPGPNSVRVSWTGIPQPQYQFVNVYRIVYIYEKEREEKHTFKLAKTSDEPSILIKGLKPSSKYQVWLEAYLKNGKKRVSEVREFDTKPGQLGKPEEIRDESAGDALGTRDPPNNYYSGMVAAAIIATMAILLCLFLAFLLVRRASRAAVEPAAARKNGPSYDNPAFKNSELDVNGANGNDRFA
ncbi:putative epidermal cell surface receptor [Pollicipes pollicipes]|uniref:putative epidermal cell surface receptor n=1 Tax=Pollicipes pollicipes TaxID=41117 RepID=UPI001885628A|nr:putative epidermal cell surface receptor [Pollicipes pollicipes]